MRIMHGLFSSAGQPYVLAEGLNTLPGVEAEALSLVGSKFQYRSHRTISVKGKSPAHMAPVLSEVYADYDIFHFHCWGFFYNPRTVDYPVGSDIMMLRASGKKVYIHFRGSEVRLQSVFASANPFHYVDDDSDFTIAQFPEQAKKDYVEMVSALANDVFVSDPELLTYVPNATIVPRAIDLDRWQAKTRPTNNQTLSIVHAPSRRGVKGTDHVIEAVEALKNRGHKFEFTLVEGMSHEQSQKIYKEADIIVDQLRIGWYGVLAVEAMALGKAVICYIRPDLERHLPLDAPLANATPENVQATLEKTITDVNFRRRLAVNARKYCEDTHCAKTIAKELWEIYRRDGKKIDEKYVFEVMLPRSMNTHGRIPHSITRLIMVFPDWFILLFDKIGSRVDLLWSLTAAQKLRYIRRAVIRIMNNE